MSKNTQLLIRLEVVWWLFTAVVAFGVLFPILQELENYPFLYANILFIVVFITLTRYIFLLQHTFLAKQQTIKTIIVLSIIPCIFYLVSEVNHFQTYADEIGLESFMEEIPLVTQQKLDSYIRSEMVFFGVGSVISAVLFPFRLIVSIWRNRNTRRS